MYNQYLKVAPCNTGNGIFTTVHIPAKVPIIEFRGEVCTAKQLPQDSSIYLQIGPDTFLSPTGTINGVDFINHSCDPNCNMMVVGKRAILFSLYEILPNTQLTFDYSTTSTDSLDDWKMTCLCGSPKCRKTISGHQYLSKEQQQEYKAKGLFPIFITNPNLISKTW